ncbi:Uncharacterized protein TCM_042441 [Theobroma cacao]|uniref:Uncharacterized protein n=1 Tax=Theobroma cacao TaxID=3641 RepID=A0A061FLC6_THECC|nr:Uncharacterized protein TCM_042441 [Theobroma cacao]
MNISSHSLMVIRTVIQNLIIATFVKKKEIQNIGFIIVQDVTIQLILSVFSKNTHLSSSGAYTQKEIIHTPSLWSRRFIITQNAINVVSFVLIWLLNVKRLDAIILSIGNV